MTAGPRSLRICKDMSVCSDASLLESMLIRFIVMSSHKTLGDLERNQCNLILTDTQQFCGLISSFTRMFDDSLVKLCPVRL